MSERNKIDDFDNNLQCEDTPECEEHEEREADDSCYQQELEDFYGSTIFDQARLFE